MVKFGNILKRSWQILWNYKILWIFGFLVALATGGRGGGNGGGGASESNRVNANPNGGFEGFREFRGQLPADAPQWMKDWAEWFTNTVVPMFTHPEQYVGTFVLIGLVILLIIVVIGLLVSLYRYPAETAIIRMVDDYETTGTKVGFKAGWKLGWNRRAFRLWLIDLVVGLPCMLLFFGLGGTAAYMIISSTAGREVVNPAGIFGGVVIALLGLLVFIMAVVFLSLLRNFFARVAVLEDAGVGESFRQGWAMFKRNWKSAGLMCLVMIGFSILFMIVSFIAFFLLIPVSLLLILPAGVVAAIPGGIAYLISSLFTAAPWTWIIAALFGLPFFGLIVSSPLNLLEGLFHIYGSNVWTLTYREIKAMENLSPIKEPIAPSAAE